MTQITKKFKVEKKEHDLVKMYRKVVKDIFTEKNVKVDYKDDDEMADYLMTLHDMGFPNYEFREITQVLMYNSMLQAQAMTLSKMEFKLVRDEYTEIMQK